MLRITGMASGLDVDNMVKTLMKAENARLDKVKQSRQTIQWKQDLYREILGDVNTFKSNYFDVLKPESYMLSANNYAGFDVTATDDANPTGAAGVTATAGASAAAGAYTVGVTQLAKPSSITGASLNETGTIDVTRWQNAKIGFSIDGGAAESIQLAVAFGDINALKDDINAKIALNDNLKGKLEAVVDNGKIQFNVLTASSVKITNDVSTTVTADLDNLKGRVINPTGSTLLGDLGMTETTDAPAAFNITYNGTTKAVSLNKTMTISDAINAISTATAGNVVAKYSQLTGQFSLSTVNTGSSAAISIDKSISALGLTAGNGTGQQDAKATINGVNVTMSKNNFSVDGISYTLVKEGTTNTVNLNANSQKTFDKIKSFIDKYNEIIDKANKKITEKTAKGFAPLTDEQKKAMKDEEIKAWETRSKEGLLRGDSDLESMLRKMRSAFFDTVQGAGVTLKEIGLDTSADISQGGKIIIDETKLKDAIKTKGNQVANIFTKSSATAYNPDGTNTSRYSEEGIFQRINDIMMDYTRTTRNTSGKRGALTEKAGIKGTTSEFSNLLSKQILDKDKMINELTRKLADKENSYYIKFSKLEQAMQNSNSQSSWLAQQLGGSR